MKIAPMRGMFPAFIVMLLLVGSAVGALAVSDGTGSLGGVHWARRGTPFTLEVGDNTRGKWPAFLRRAARQWNRSGVVRFQVVSGGVNPNKCKQTNGRVEVCSGNYGQEGWLGLTRLFYANNDKQHIIAATTRLNDSYFNQKNGTYNTKNARRHTVCHELGHTVGLEHVNTRSCLNDSERAIQDNVKPIKKDFKTLAKLYKHKDKGKSTIGAASTGARSVQSIDFIEIEAPTRQTSITSFLPDGTRVVTIVTWADE